MAVTLEMNDDSWVNNPFVLGQHVRAKRKAQGLTQGELSEKSGVSSRHISDIENGLKNVGAYTLFKILNSLDIALYIGAKPLPFTHEELEEKREKEFQEIKENRRTK